MGDVHGNDRCGLKTKVWVILPKSCQSCPTHSLLSNPSLTLIRPHRSFGLLDPLLITPITNQWPPPSQMYRPSTDMTPLTCQPPPPTIDLNVTSRCVTLLWSEVPLWPICFPDWRKSPILMFSWRSGNPVQLLFKNKRNKSFAVQCKHYMACGRCQFNTFQTAIAFRQRGMPIQEYSSKQHTTCEVAWWKNCLGRGGVVFHNENDKDNMHLIPSNKFPWQEKSSKIFPDFPDQVETLTTLKLPFTMGIYPITVTSWE